MSEATLAKVDIFKNLLNAQTIQAQIKRSMKENAGAFMSSMIDLYSGDKSLQECDPEKVLAECVKAASLKLPLVKSLGLAYVVPYKKVPTFTVGYRGFIQLAQRSGQYQTINADNVYEGELVGQDKISGMINVSGQRESDTVIGYFAYFKLLNGFEKMLYMSREDVEEWAKRYSPSFNSNFSPWKNEFDKMAQKTVLRRLIGTYGILSLDMQTAIVQDDKGKTPVQEIKENANKTPIDVNFAAVDTETGEVLETDVPPAEDIPPAKAPF